MISSLQPSRPKPPQQPGQPTYAYQQRRAVHDTSPPPRLPETRSGASERVETRPRSQIEAMPPHEAAPFQPPHAFYNSAMRHPVFFTANLKKPPFPIPQLASQGWSPVASGYIMEQQRALSSEPRTKL